ncbi:DsbA family protein [Siphonobacter sp. SORGH_AS_0500]|uniref:DsbA family protein n=1 Tax=Siphonobacter sp. SORGH_AS_0500 TaxID=1864824 RepID=UPI002854515D|nr:DsbA family protein [Siphonobacter sp. SORGH_AS_0500]MDR6198086.1 putative protein-disulfide isomerase [Siphonobacter sp. SORGH_AS_0500]
MKIIYVMDPICGWCYGNIDNTVRLFEDFKEQVEFEVLPGGMWSGANTRIQSTAMMNYFLKHDASITHHTGVLFGSAYLDFIKNRHDVVLDSEIPSKAIVTVSMIAPNQIMPFAVEVLKARFLHGKDYNLDSTYIEILAKLQINENQFLNFFKTNEFKQMTQDVFKKAASYARSYPTMLAEKDDQLYLLEQGYLPYEELKARVVSLLK